MDVDGFDSFMADEAQLRFGNNEPASGHDQIHGAIGKFWDSIDDLRHEFTGIWEQDDVVLEASIRYTKLDGEAVWTHLGVKPRGFLLQRRALHPPPFAEE